LKRAPAVSGQFYYSSPSRLNAQIESFIDKRAKKENAKGIVVPHAGLIYSGHVAGAVYSSINFPKTFVLIGPNHTGVGERISMMDSGEWEIPTGILCIDNELAHKIFVNVPIVKKDFQAHVFEHSLEVQLPFILYFSNDVKIVPILILSADLDDCKILGEGIADAIKSFNYDVVVVASSDMSHYVPDSVARHKDKKAIDMILSLNPEGLYETVLKERISMCGYLPVVSMIYAIKKLGGHSARLVKYATSGEISGDYDYVVGYAGIILR
jgi:AmmeMemoRadiSam system protein B